MPRRSCEAESAALRFECEVPPKMSLYWKDSQDKEYRKDFVLSWYSGSSISLGCFMSHLANLNFSPDYFVGAKVGTEAMPKWGKHDVPKEILDKLVEHLIKSFTATFILIGRHSNAGSPASPNGQAPDGMVEFFNTTDFVELLIKHKIGIVYASPIGRNASHASQKDTSLCQKIG